MCTCSDFHQKGINDYITTDVTTHRINKRPNGTTVVALPFGSENTNSNTSVSSLRVAICTWKFKLTALLHDLLWLVAVGLLDDRSGPLAGDQKITSNLNTSSSMNLGYQVQYFVKFLLPRIGGPTGNHKCWTL